MKFNDVMMALLLNSDKGVRPSGRDVYRRLKHEYKKKTPAWKTLHNWRTQAKRLKGGVEDALAVMPRSGRPPEFTEAHQQQIDDALTDNKYLPDSQLAADLGVCLPTAMKYKEMAGWCTAHTRRVTLLNPTHKVERNSFSENHRGKELRHRAAGDEKLFQNIPPAKMSVKMEPRPWACRRWSSRTIMPPRTRRRGRQSRPNARTASRGSPSPRPSNRRARRT